MGLSQQVLAERCGVGARTQRNYEAGERLPDAAYLAAFAEAGGDVLYVVTGSRDPDHAALDAAERVLLDSYRRCNAQARANLIQTAALLAAGLPSGTGPASGGSMTNTGTGAVQVGHAGGDVKVGRRGR